VFFISRSTHELLVSELPHAGFVSRWSRSCSPRSADELFGGYPWRYELADAPDFIERYYGAWSRLLTPGARRFLPAKISNLIVHEDSSTRS